MRLVRVACTISVLVAPLYAQTHHWVRSPLNGHLYAQTLSRGGWVTLEAEAVAAGGHLATIRSQAELDWIMANFTRGYIGLTDSGTEGVWEWASGEPVTFIKWRPHEPYGTRGSVRLDVVEGPLDAPIGIYDLKTGGAVLSPKRVNQIRSHLPGGGGNVPIIEIR